MKQTAVEWLQEQYNNCPKYEAVLTESDFKQAKELEKQHIMEANTVGVNCGLYGYKNALEYYNKTFTKPTRIANDNINVTNK